MASVDPFGLCPQQDTIKSTCPKPDSASQVPDTSQKASPFGGARLSCGQHIKDFGKSLGLDVLGAEIAKGFAMLVKGGTYAELALRADAQGAALASEGASGAGGQFAKAQFFESRSASTTLRGAMGASAGGARYLGDLGGAAATEDPAYVIANALPIVGTGVKLGSAFDRCTGIIDF